MYIIYILYILYTHVYIIHITYLCVSFPSRTFTTDTTAREG